MTTLGCMTIVAPERGNPTVWLGIGSVPKLDTKILLECLQIIKFNYQGNIFFKLNYSVYSAITVTWHVGKSQTQCVVGVPWSLSPSWP